MPPPLIAYGGGTNSTAGLSARYHRQMQTPIEAIILQISESTGATPQRMLAVTLDALRSGHVTQVMAGAQANLLSESAGILHLAQQMSVPDHVSIPTSVLAHVDMALSVQQRLSELNGADNPKPPPKEKLEQGYVYFEVGVMNYEAIKAARLVIRQIMLEDEGFAGRIRNAPRPPRRDGGER